MLSGAVIQLQTIHSIRDNVHTNMYVRAVLKFQSLKEAPACWQCCRSQSFLTVSVSCSFDMHAYALHTIIQRLAALGDPRDLNHKS